MVDGVTVLEPRDEREKNSLPERSEEPYSSYMCYYKKKDKKCGESLFLR